MAVRGNFFGKKIVLKSSGGRHFVAGAVRWTDKPSARPEKVKAQNKAFSAAVIACKSENKGKGGTVFGVSDYNDCIGKKLGK